MQGDQLVKYFQESCAFKCIESNSFVTIFREQITLIIDVRYNPMY